MQTDRHDKIAAIHTFADVPKVQPRKYFYQVFLSITYIHAYDYILAANPRCPKV